MDESRYNEIYELENLLNSNNYEIEYEEIIADGFCEFGSSGRIYSKNDTLDALRKRENLKIEMRDFKLSYSDENIALATYKAEIYKDGESGTVSISLRSSIWRKKGLSWEIIFHQGTKVE